jgi:hypothetical protein
MLQPSDRAEGVMISNRVVIRYRDGRVLKGTVSDFSPARDGFHLATADGAMRPVDRQELKAVFFVRDFDGDRRRPRSNVFPAGRPVVGRKIAVRFADGEVLVGTTVGYRPERPGFFLVPADPESNNQRCFVVAAATSEVRMF